MESWNRDRNLKIVYILITIISIFQVIFGLNILVLSIDDYSAAKPSGRVLNTLTLTKELSRLAKVTFAATTAIHPNNRVEGVECITIPGRVGREEIRRPIKSLINISRLYRGLKHILEGYDIVYSDATYYPKLGRGIAKHAVEANSIIGTELRMKASVPLTGLMARWADYLEKRTMRNADVCIAVTPQLREYLMNRYGLDGGRVHHVPNGVDTDHFARVNKEKVKKIREKYSLSRGKTAIFVGGFRPWHGVCEIVEAFRGAVKNEPDAKLLMVGDGPLREEMRELVKDKGLEDSVVFTGQVPYAEVPNFLHASDIGVYYSRLSDLHRIIGGSPLKVGEYMAASLAVIAGPVPYISRAESEAGAMLGVKDERGLEMALCSLLGDQELRKSYVLKGREYAEKNLSVQVVGKKIYNILRGVVD